MPAVGLGTWQGREGSDDEKTLEASIVHALRSGYRLIDTAQYYGVEHVVGRAIRASGIDRADITVVTKFWGEWHHDPAAALSISLAHLELDYVDILLMHWPWATTPAPDRKMLRKNESPTVRETWALMEALVGVGCRGIGVSNFSQATIAELLETARIIPVINQVELHALNPCLRLVPYCRERGIHVMSWRTLGGSNLPNPVLTGAPFTTIAEAHGVSAGVVSLSWVVQRGVTVIPKSARPERIDENIRLVTLTEDEMAQMNDAHKTIGFRRFGKEIKSQRMEVDGKMTLQGWTMQDLGWEDEQGNDLS